MRPHSDKKLNALTSLRFFAAAAVVMVHAAEPFHIPINAWSPLALNNGVSFFFVLSGFILTYVYGLQGKLDGRRFLLARVARIWPAHVAALLLFLLLTPVETWRKFSPVILLANLSMTHAWVGRYEFFTSYVGPSWSISVEFAFYLCFIFLVRDLRRTLVWKLAGSFMLLIVTGVVANWLDKHGPPVPDQRWISGLMYFSPYGRLFEFVLGMSTAVLWQHFSPKLRMGMKLGTIVEVAAVLLVIGSLAVAKSWAETPWVNRLVGSAGQVWLCCGGFSCVAIAILIFVMALERGILSRWLSKSIPVLLGEISYSIYLLHFTLIYFLVHNLGMPRPVPDWQGFLVYCLMTLTASYLIWALIEKPCRRFLVNLWPQRPNHAPDELPASIKPPVPRAVCFSWRGVVIATGGLVLCGIIIARQPDPCLGRITMVPRPGSHYAGCFDLLNDTHIAGWAWDSRSPRKTVRIEIYDGDILLLTAAADQRREDLAGYLGDCAHAFVCFTPESLKDGRRHEIHVRVAKSRFELDSSPRSLKSGP